jgi:cytoskeleton protein RodZ
LRAAREAKGMTVGQLADQTRVRISALEAIEVGEFDRLPEPIYVQSYLRAYAQAVGVPIEPILEAFRRSSPGVPAPSAHATSISNRTIETTVRRGVPVGGIVAGLAVLALVGGYLFVSLRSQILPGMLPGTAPIGAPVTPGTGTGGATAPGTRNSGTPASGTSDPGTNTSGSDNPAPTTGTVTLSVTSNPKGASVLLDGIRIGVTPLVNAPVTPGSSRELRVELAGFKPSVETVDLSSDRSYIAKLIPSPPAGATTVSGATPGQVTLTFQGASWVRITDTAGRRVFEGTPAKGSVKNFSGPVTVRAGRPDLIVASIGGKPRGALGAKASPATVRLP